MQRLLIASTNPGKIREIRTVLGDVPWQLLTLRDLPPIDEPEESGRTFADNARLKAIRYARASALPTVAEDSGLMIDALDGRPGVESARYPGATYADKFANLYRELAPHPRPWRARFICSLAFASQATGDRRQAAEDLSGALGLGPGACCRVLFTCEASVEGEIAPEARGEYGFGYDPIFFYPPYGCTLGEVTDERKLAVAHRGKAFRQFRDWLKTSQLRTENRNALQNRAPHAGPRD